MSQRHHRPSMPGAWHFEAIEGAVDPAELGAAADRAATALVRGARARAGDGHTKGSGEGPGEVPGEGSDRDVIDRVVRLAETEGLDTLAELWSGAPAESLAGSLWRLYLLRTWVHADPVRAAAEFARGRAHVPVGAVVSGVVDPPGPDEVRHLVDQVLGGVVVGDFADTLLRASAFARVTASGRAHDDDQPGYDSDLSASRLLTLADQLERAGLLELDQRLS